MTMTFAILLGIIFLMEIGAGIAAYQLKGKVSKVDIVIDKSSILFPEIFLKTSFFTGTA